MTAQICNGVFTRIFRLYRLDKNRTPWVRLLVMLGWITAMGSVTSCKKTATQTETPAPPASSTVEATANPTSPWEIVKVDDREYVTAESLAKFYRFSTSHIQGSSLLLGSSHIELRAEADSTDITINRMKVVLEKKVLLNGDRMLFSRSDLAHFLDPLLRPSRIPHAERFDTVVLDAGEPEIQGQDISQDLSLRVALALRKELMERGFKVVMTRENSTAMSDEARVKLANATPKSILLSLHLHLNEEAMNNVETLALTAPENPSATLPLNALNIALAAAVHGSVVSRLKLTDHGIKRADVNILKGCEGPGIVFAGGISPARADSYLQEVCPALATAVMNYGKALKVVASSK